MGDATSLLFDLPGFRVIECVEELGASHRQAATAIGLAVPPVDGAGHHQGRALEFVTLECAGGKEQESGTTS
jgi:hypothetical protein